MSKDPKVRGKRDVMADLASRLRTLARETRRPEAEVMTQAFEVGVRQLWRERALARYLRGEMSREQAIEAAGIDWVELAERQRKAVVEDLAWALQLD